MSASVVSEGRVSNIYVEPDAMTPPTKGIARPFSIDEERVREVAQHYDSDGYMEPAQLKRESEETNCSSFDRPDNLGPCMTLSQLSDTYLTASPLEKPSSHFQQNTSAETNTCDGTCTQETQDVQSGPMYANSKLWRVTVNPMDQYIEMGSHENKKTKNQDT